MLQFSQVSFLQAESGGRLSGSQLSIHVPALQREPRQEMNLPIERGDMGTAAARPRPRRPAPGRVIKSLRRCVDAVAYMPC